MAPSGITSVAASSAPARSSGPSGSEKLQGALAEDLPSLAGQNYNWVFSRNPTMLRMVLEALKAQEQPRGMSRGMSVVAIKVYIQSKYPTAADAGRFKYLLKQALDTGMRRGLLTRPVNSRARGATGSFKLVPKYKKKVQARKPPVPKVPRRPREAVGKGSKKPGAEQKEASSSGQAARTVPRPGLANQGVPKRGRREAKGAEATKPPPKPAKATRAPSRANGTSEKGRAKGKRRQPDAEACGKPKVKNASSEVKDAGSKPADRQVKNGVSSPTRRKMAAKTPKEKVSQGPGQRSRPKAAAVPRKGDGSTAVPTAVARKTEAPEGLRKPRLPTKSPSSKARSKKVEAEK
ncbi:histone H1.8 [Callospermophilus lateralis]|uniref:histone H1.8 n=1 Tax=Callospermophilus lateralis TaxID=76772 RepID=UPI0040541993